MTKKQRQLKKAFRRMLRAQEPVILEKLMHNERKYGFGWGWRDNDWQEDLWRALPEHVTKGDPRDVVIYGAFCIYHGWRTAPPGQPYLNHRGEQRDADPNLPTIP
jgi:hypothetical protein